MALKRNKNGTYTIKTLADTKRALELGHEIKRGIHDDMVQSTELVKAATAFFTETDEGIEAIENGLELDDGSEAKVVQRYTRFWIGTDDDMPDDPPREARSLKSLCGKRKIERKGKTISLWNFLTRRVPDAERIENAINLGLISEEDVAPAFVEKPQKPFIQVSGEGNGDA